MNIQKEQEMIESSARILKSVDPNLETIPKLSSKQITDRILKESLKAVIEESEEDMEELSSIEKSLDGQDNGEVNITAQNIETTTTEGGQL